MRNLLEFLSRYHHCLVFLLLEVVSLVLLFQYNSYQGSVWFSSANMVSGKILEADAWMGAFFSQGAENEQLTLRNVQLEQEVLALREQLAELSSRDSTVQSRGNLPLLRHFNVIPAKVVGNSVHRMDNLITIDKGTADGVKRDMGVACGTGVVGIVYMVSAHYAVVLPVLNKHSNISCAIRSRGYFGYLHWNGERSDQAFVDDIPRHAKFEVGDTIVTSGYSDVFPPGLLVGHVIKSHDSRDGLSYRLQVQLSTDYANLRDVVVIDNATLREKIDLMKQAQDSIKPQKKN
ncbi:MAG: rod shape-determining protein MreC [Prevotella sp.]|nr:rod shape-determining protein MreC [Prevotella sp.]